MMQIVFDDGKIIDYDHIAKIYYDEAEYDKVTMVGNLKEMLERQIETEKEMTK